MKLITSMHINNGKLQSSSHSRGRLPIHVIHDAAKVAYLEPSLVTDNSAATSSPTLTDSLIAFF